MDEKMEHYSCDCRWYAVRTFYNREESVGRYFAEKDVHYFIPMCYREKVGLDGKRHRELLPAVHNLLFVKKMIPEREFRKIISECPISVSVVCKEKTGDYYEIREREMLEFRAICDPNYKGTIYVDAAVAEARPGQKVRVIHGTFKGLEGKLVRYKNRSYVVITLLALGIMVHIPKWYCEKIM